MSSRQCTDHFQNDDLEVLQATLDECWTTLKAHHPHRDWDAEHELKTRIAEKIMALASAGITAPEELRRRALDALPLALGRD